MLAVAKEVRARKIENVLHFILVSLFTPGWYQLFPLPSDSQPKFAASTICLPTASANYTLRRVFAFRSEVGRSQDFPAMGTQSKTASS